MLKLRRNRALPPVAPESAAGDAAGDQARGQLRAQISGPAPGSSTTVEPTGARELIAQDAAAPRAQRAARLPPQAPVGERISAFLAVDAAELADRYTLVMLGLNAGTVEDLARGMQVPKEKLVNTLGLARATVDRKARAGTRLSSDESSRVLGLQRLVDQVQAMVEASGEPAGFDAAQWVARWLEEPLPALGHRQPAEFMKATEGQLLVSSILARLQSGAYA